MTKPTGARVFSAEPWRLLCAALVINVGSALAPSQAEAQIPRIEPIDDPIVRYLGAIESAENEFGSYAPELSDLYSGLGQAYLEIGNFDKALDAMQRGVLVVRVNAGLMSAEQLNQLFEVASLENYLGEFQRADEILQSIHLINDEAHREDPGSRLGVYEQMLDWYTDQRPLQRGLARFSDYRAVQEINENLAQLSEKVKGPGHPDTAKAYRRLGQSYFRVARFVIAHGNQVEPGALVSILPPPYVEDAEMISVLSLFNAGTQAFERYVQCVQQNEHHTPVEYAEALAQLGDWYLVSDKPRTAWEKYELAYQVLLDAEGSEELADAYLGRPAPLTLLYEETEFTGDQGDEESDPEGQVQLSMTVSRYGEVSYVKVVGAPESLTDNDLRAIKDKLERTVFRPRIDQGTVVQTKDFLWGFSVSPTEGST